METACIRRVSSAQTHSQPCVGAAQARGAVFSAYAIRCTVRLPIRELASMLRLMLLATCFSGAGLIDFAILSGAEVSELTRAAAIALLVVAGSIHVERPESEPGKK